jgi:hypothetical protein
LYFAANCFAKSTWVRSRPKINNGIIGGSLGLGEIDMRRAGRVEAVGPYVTDDADYGDVNWIC